MKKETRRTTTEGTIAEVIDLEARRLGPRPPRCVSQGQFGVVLAARRARVAIESYFSFEEDPDLEDKEMREDARDFHVKYFSARGVRFDAEGEVLLPYGRCPEIDLEVVLADVMFETHQFFFALGEEVAMGLTGEFDEIEAFGWRHGVFQSHVHGHPDEWLVPVVLTLDLTAMSLVTDNRASKDFPRGTEKLDPLEKLFAEQQPERWKSWKARSRTR
jgi:hypothetical protein